MEKEQLEKYKNQFYKKISKGWILTYVVIISMFISLMVCYLMKSFENRNFYMSNYKEYSLKEDTDYNYKEHIMATFNNYMLKNLESIKAEDIDKYFESKVGEKLVSYNGSYITYSSKEKLFQISGLNRIYKFTIIINSDKVKYIFK